MKAFKLLIGMAMTAALFCACDKEDSVDPENGFGGYDDSRDVLTDYMLGIADELATRSLDELEQALKVDPTTGTARYFYETGGKPLTEPGACWTVLRNGEFEGLTLTCLQAEGTWRLDFDGDFSLRYYTFPTRFTLTATVADPAENDPHRGWMVTFDGTRTESKGYSCRFFTDEPIHYKAFATDPLWGAYGYLLMDVFEKEARIDRVVMELRGGKNNTTIAHIR